MQLPGAIKPVTFDDYARLALATDRFATDKPDIHYQKLSFGFYGEIGSLLSALKKVQRDQLEITEQEQARIELGDALWYLTCLARLCGVSGDELGHAAYISLRVSLGAGRSRHNGAVHLNQLHGLAAAREPQLVRQKDNLLRQAGLQAGVLVSYAWPLMSTQPQDWLSALMGDCLAQIALLCVAFKLDLSDVAHANLDKTFDRWPAPGRRKYVLPARKGESWEQFEPKYVVTFRERPPGGKRVIQQIKGLNVGDPLTDNMEPGDGYRFHDVFHLAYAAHLGWSPVIRALLKLKRKSDKKVDENEDGARAIIIEEGIATWIFNDAKRRKFYKDIQSQRLDWAILQQVRSMVQGFEVRDVPLWQWEVAILDGFRVFRELLDNKGGIVTVDVAKHALHYNLLPADIK
jgi:hypothetical protein